MTSKIKRNVVDEELEGELLAIDDVTGKYFAIGGAGAWIWQCLRRGTNVADIVAQAPEHANAIEGFVANLTTEALTIDLDSASTEPPSAAPSPWAKPSFESFSDLQDLLLFDPIHEVSDAGWPAVAADGAD